MDEEKGSEIFRSCSKSRLHGILYKDELILHGESEEVIRVITVRSVEVCKREGPKVMVFLVRRNRSV